MAINVVAPSPIVAMVNAARQIVALQNLATHRALVLVALNHAQRKGAPTTASVLSQRVNRKDIVLQASSDQLCALE